MVKRSISIPVFMFERYADRIVDISYCNTDLEEEDTENKAFTKNDFQMKGKEMYKWIKRRRINPEKEVKET